MKKLVLISSYCDTDEKLNALVENIKKIKELNLDVLLLSPISIPINVIELCDYYFETKDNPVLHWPDKGISIWKRFSLMNKDLTFYKTFSDHGWAGLYQTKMLSKLGLLLDYDRYYHIIYDIVIDDFVIEQFLDTNKVKSVYPSKYKDTVWPVGLHFMIFDKKNLFEFEKHITLDSYLTSSTDDALAWLHKLHQTFKYDIEKIPVNESIKLQNNTESFEFYNYSKIDGLMYFISKDMHTFENIQILIYQIDFTKIKEVFINNVKVKPFEIITLNYNGKNIKPTNITVNGKTYDITHIIDSIEHNVIEIINSNINAKKNS